MFNRITNALGAIAIAFVVGYCGVAIYLLAASAH